MFGISRTFGDFEVKKLMIGMEAMQDLSPFSTGQSVEVVESKEHHVFVAPRA